MTDEERRHWRNLIYLCTPHHQYVDRERPQDYPIHVLERWKADREQGPMAQLQGLSGLTEDKLREMIQHGAEWQVLSSGKLAHDGPVEPGR